MLLFMNTILISIVFGVAVLGSATNSGGTSLGRNDSRELVSTAFGSIKRIQNPRIGLETTVLSKETTSADDELRTVRIRLKLSFTNKERAVVWIYKGRTAITHIWLSRSKSEALNRKYESSIAQTILTEGEKTFENLGPEDFTVLRQNESFSVEETITALVRMNENDKVPGSVSKGEYYLQLNVETWSWTTCEADSFRRTLPKDVMLITEPIISLPMLLIIQ